MPAQVESTISCRNRIHRSRSSRGTVETESGNLTRTMLRCQGPSKLRIRPKAEEQTLGANISFFNLRRLFCQQSVFVILGHSGDMVHLSSSAVSLNKSSGQFCSERIAKELERTSADWFKVASNWKRTNQAGTLANASIAPCRPTRMYRPPASAPALSRPLSQGTTSLKLPRIVFDDIVHCAVDSGGVIRDSVKK